MKKQILSILLIVSMFISAFSFMGCGSSAKYAYEECSTHYPYNSLVDELDYVYEDTRLNIYENGTWSIDMSFILFIRSKIDKGTYTVENGVYTFEGFEYGWAATGKETDEGFEIAFYDTVNDRPTAHLFFER